MPVWVYVSREGSFGVLVNVLTVSCSFCLLESDILLQLLSDIFYTLFLDLDLHTPFFILYTSILLHLLIDVVDTSVLVFNLHTIFYIWQDMIPRK
jgi:hypothetical protein